MYRLSSKIRSKKDPPAIRPISGCGKYVGKCILCHMCFARNTLLATFGAAIVACAAANSETVFPVEGWEDNPNPFASERAIPGGRIVVSAGAVPKSLNVLLDNNTFSSQVFGLMYESLLGMDGETAEYAPGLANKWTVSDDGRVFIFSIDPEARWSDGRPVTAEDVKWTFDAIMNPKHMTGPHKVALATFVETPPEVLSEREIRFTASEVHWRNLGAAGGFPVMPKHAFDGADFNKINFEFPVVSGPYKVGEMRENLHLDMARRRDWWAGSKASNKNIYNFDTIRFVFFSDSDNAWESFRKGRFDLLPVYTARIWAQETTGERFDKNWIVKREIRNRNPVGFQGFAMNTRRAPYNDVRVRKALAHLLDRETMNETMMHGSYFLHRSYFEDIYDAAHPCTNIFYEYNPGKAAELLRKAGWLADPESGALTKDGRPLVLNFVSNSGTSDKFLARYKADLAEQGIGLEIERKDWAAWARDMDEYNFDITWAAWSAGLRKDPEGMWSSKYANSDGGNNITGFSDPRVDALIEKQRTEFSLVERNEICREIDAILTDAVPYILLWNMDATRLLWWNKFGVPENVLSKYGSHEDAMVYWWYDPDSADALSDAMEKGLTLP